MVLLAQLPGLRGSGVLGMLLISSGAGPVGSRMPDSPLVLRVDRFGLKVSHPYCWKLVGPGCQAGGICCQNEGDDCGGMLQG